MTGLVEQIFERLNLFRHLFRLVLVHSQEDHVLLLRRSCLVPEVILKRLPVTNSVGLISGPALLISRLHQIRLFLLPREEVFRLLGFGLALPDGDFQLFYLLHGLDKISLFCGF